MNISARATLCLQHNQLYEYICAYGQHSTIFCMSEFLRHCQTYSYQHYHAVRLTTISAKTWLNWNDSLIFFLTNTRQVVLANGTPKVFDFIPKKGSEYEFTKYEHMLSEYAILGEIKAVALQIIEDFILRMKQIGREFNLMRDITPQTVDRSVMRDIYRFFLQTPEDYLQEIRTGITDRLRIKATSLNIIYKFINIKFKSSALSAYENERDRLIAPIYSQTVYLYNSVHHTLIPQQFSYGSLQNTRQFTSNSLLASKSLQGLHSIRRYEPSNISSRIVRDHNSLERSRIRSTSKNLVLERDQTPLVLQSIRSAMGRSPISSSYKEGRGQNVDYYRQRCLELQLKINSLQAQNLSLDSENKRLRQQRLGGEEMKNLYEQYWLEQLEKLSIDRKNLEDQVNRLKRQQQFYRR